LYWSSSTELVSEKTSQHLKRCSCGTGPQRPQLDPTVPPGGKQPNASIKPTQQDINRFLQIILK